MKKALYTPLFLLLFFCLSACGQSRAPYLSDEERSQITGSLFDNLVIEKNRFDVNDFVFITVSNSTDYNLADVEIRLSEADNSIYFPILPRNSEATDRVYIGRGTAEISVGSIVNTVLSYTIETYTYKTESREVRIQEKQIPELIVETDMGSITLAPGETTELPEDASVKGAEEIPILSFTYSPLFQYDGSYTIDITCNLQGQTDGSYGYIYSRIDDGNGNLVATENSYVGYNNDNFNINLYGVILKLPVYYLRFSV